LHPKCGCPHLNSLVRLPNPDCGRLLWTAPLAVFFFLVLPVYTKRLGCDCARKKLYDRRCFQKVLKNHQRTYVIVLRQHFRWLYLEMYTARWHTCKLDVCFWCERYGVQIPSRSNLTNVANDSPPLQSWCVVIVVVGVKLWI